MALHLVTGRAGAEHVTGADHGALHAALLVAGNVVLNTGNKFSASAVTSNSIKILDGELLIQGRHVRLKPGTYETVTIENGAQDYKRNDLIVVRYTMNENTGIENTSFVVIKGTQTTSTATDPAYTDGDIINGDLVCDMPLYRVPIDGLSVGALVPLFEVVDNFDERIKEILNGVKAVGNASKLGGNAPSYYASAVSVARIQTTSTAVLSTPGWYRVAEYSNISVPNLRGANGNSCKIELKRAYTTDENESIGLILSSKTNEQEFNASYAISNATKHLLTKVRYTYDSAKAYIEIYYSGTTKNSVFVSITDCSDISSTWKAITLTLTEETVDGVTVTTTYDIPANASPVTDLDIADLVSETDLTTALDKYMRDNKDYGYNFFGSYSLNDWLKSGCYASNSLCTNYPPTTTGAGDVLVIVGYTSARVTQIFRDWSNDNLFYRAFNKDTWTGWKTLATTADLANYVPKSGGDVNGNLFVTGNINATTTEAVARNISLKNALRRVYQELNVSGDYSLYDSTNSKHIIRSTKDGTNTFNGTASGNLALSGGGTVSRASREVMSVNNTSSDVNATIGFKAKGTSIGEIGVSTEIGAFYRTTTGLNHDILHTGNSMKLVVSETPLSASDTDKIRIW